MVTQVRVAVMGCNGRMGRTLLAGIEDSEFAVVGAAIERPECNFLGADVGELAGLGTLGVKISLLQMQPCSISRLLLPIIKILLLARPVLLKTKKSRSKLLANILGWYLRRT